MSDYITIPTPAHDDPQLRRAYWMNALSLIGLEAANPTHRATWLEILGPVDGKWDLDRPFSVTRDKDGNYHTKGVSTCALVAEGIWRRMGVDLQLLYQKYINYPYKYAAITRARNYGSSCGAWRTAKNSLRPQVGDYVVIGTGMKTHVLTALEWEGDTLVSVDGGQVGTRGLQAIKECRRAWKPDSKGAVLGTRRVVGWIDVTALGYRGTSTVPACWETE